MVRPRLPATTRHTMTLAMLGPTETTPTPITPTLSRVMILSGLLTFGLGCTLILIDTSMSLGIHNLVSLRTAGHTRAEFNTDTSAVKIINTNHHMLKRSKPVDKRAKCNMFTQERRAQTVR